jgi:hypothetical protein
LLPGKWAFARQSITNNTALDRLGGIMPAVALETPLRELLQRVRGEYLEMPGLRLTTEQAKRLWSLDLRTCRSILDALVEAKFLARSRDGKYCRLSYV